MREQPPWPGIRKSRRTVIAVARLRTPVREWDTEVLDISLSGLRSSRPHGFDLAASQVVEVELDFEQPVRALTLKARVARLGEDHVAFRFEPLPLPLEAELRHVLEQIGHLKDEFQD